MGLDDRCGSSVLRKISPKFTEEEYWASVRELQRVSCELRDFNERLERTSMISQEALLTVYY